MRFSSHGDKSDKAEMMFIQKLMNMPLLDREEEQSLSQSWVQNKDEKSLQKLVKAYTRLVVSTAIRYRHFGLPVSDLIQEGVMGLMQAALRFDPDREIRFSTYAKWWIRSTIQDYVLKNWSIVRTGSTSAQRMLFFHLRRLRAKLASMHPEINRSGGELLNPTEVEHICEALHVSANDVKEMEGRLASNDLSLNAAVSDDTGDNWIDFLVDERPDPEDMAIKTFDGAVRKGWIQKAFHTLDKREKTIISGRRLKESPQTLDDLGKKLKLSKERVRQIETRAIRKMRHHLMQNLCEVRELIS